MSTKKQQTEMQRVINILRPHMCPDGLKTLNSYAKLSIREAWNKCTVPSHLFVFKLLSVYSKDKKFKKEFASVIKKVFKEIYAKIKEEANAIPEWVSLDLDWDVLPNIEGVEDNVITALKYDLDNCFDVSEEIDNMDVHAIIKKHIKAPTLQDFLDIKIPNAEQKLVINDWKKIPDEKMFKLLVQHKLYDSSGKRLFKVCPICNCIEDQDDYNRYCTAPVPMILNPKNRTRW